jgi:RimJ/RimL family protein N-acetyltransferase
VIRLEGERVVLRPFAPEELEAVWEYRSVGSVVGSASEKERVLQRLRQSGRWIDGRLDLAIEAEARVVGNIDARRTALPPGVFALGIGLFRSADRGRGWGTESVRLLTDHLFALERAARVEASTDVANAAMRRVLEKVGFAQEGILREFMPGRGGGRDDYVLYAITRRDHES